MQYEIGHYSLGVTHRRRATVLADISHQFSVDQIWIRWDGYGNTLVKLEDVRLTDMQQISIERAADEKAAEVKSGCMEALQRARQPTAASARSRAGENWGVPGGVVLIE